MKLAHMLVAAILVAVVVLVKVLGFPRPLFGFGEGGASHLSVRIDPRAAALIRAWRRAHGYSSHLLPADAASTAAVEEPSFKRICERSGHRVVDVRHDGRRVRICQ